MNQVQNPADFVIGVDTHKHTHTASVVDARGMKLDAFELPADAAGYIRMLTLVQRRAPGTRIWAIEGAGGYGSELATHLIQRDERVIEIDRPKRPARRDRAKHRIDTASLRPASRVPHEQVIDESLPTSGPKPGFAAGRIRASEPTERAPPATARYGASARAIRNPR